MSHSKDWREQRYIKVRELSEKFGVAKSTIYKWMNEKNFSKPVVFGEAKKNATVRWLESEIEEWLESRPRGKDD